MDFKKGDRVELVSMDDPQAPAAGTRGTVYGVDAIGDILINWDDGNALNVIPTVDIIKKISS